MQTIKYINVDKQESLSTKSTAILAGFLKEQVVAGQGHVRIQDAAEPFALLLSMLTDSDKAVRAAAKCRVKTLAVNGGWLAPIKPRANSPKSNLACVEGKETTRKRSGSWSDLEKTQVVGKWSDPASKHDAECIKTICEETGRSPLAVIIRLFQEGMISVPEADGLCLTTGASRRLSETNVVLPQPAGQKGQAQIK